jgi:hypothetical protein
MAFGKSSGGPGMVVAIHSLKPSLKGFGGPSKPPEPDDETGEDREGMKAAFQDLLKAIESKDVEAGTEALENFFEICDSGPHEEGEHTEPEEGEEEGA